jgi:pimeloyl-ACP methyl ester carboxylesterase
MYPLVQIFVDPPPFQNMSMASAWVPDDDKALIGCTQAGVVLVPAVRLVPSLVPLTVSSWVHPDPSKKEVQISVVEAPFHANTIGHPAALPPRAGAAPSGWFPVAGTTASCFLQFVPVHQENRIPSVGVDCPLYANQYLVRLGIKGQRRRGVGAGDPVRAAHPPAPPSELPSSVQVFWFTGDVATRIWSLPAKFHATCFRVLAFDFRGFGKSHGPGDTDMYTAPMHLDVLAAVRYLRQHAAKTVSVMGGSFGGNAAADASIASQPGEIDRLILLAAEGNGPAERIKSPLLVIVARDDANGEGPRLPRIRAWFDQAPEPKQLIVLDGSAHAQFLFQSEQADRVMKEIIRFLTPKK